MAAYHHLEAGIVRKSFDAFAAGNGAAGTEFAVPATTDHTPKSFTWRSSWNNNPSAIALVLQGTLDFVNWFQLDTSTVTAGETKSVVDKVIRGIRAFVTTITPHGSGTLVTIEILMS